MVNTCCALNCRNGYKNETEEGTTMHKFPLKNPEILKIWTENLKREYFVPNQNSRICSKHFTESCFKTDSDDKNSTRKRRRTNSCLARRFIKEDAVPTLFEGLPSYLAPKSEVLRTKNATSVGRLESSMQRITDLEEKHNEEDMIQFPSIEDQLRNSTLPNGFEIFKSTTEYLLIVFVKEEGIPELLASVKLMSDESVFVVVRGLVVEQSKFSHFLDSSGSIQTVSNLWNLLALVKFWIESGEEKSLNSFISNASKILGDAKEFLNENNNIQYKLEFIEQMDLLCVSKKSRRYSTNLIILSYSLFCVSSTCYETLSNSNYLCLPTVRHLRNIANRLIDVRGHSCKQYLSSRIKNLSQYSRYVTLIIDEIHVSKRVELTGGRILGFSESNPSQLATTVLCFMISSTGCKYRDIVSMVPVNKLSAEFIEQKLDQVLCTVHDIGFQVMAISTDNHPANRSLFKNLSKTCLEEVHVSISNSYCRNEPLYIMMDTTHNIKNIYNIFQGKGFLKFPVIPGTSDSTTANFQHFRDLYELELGKPTKLAPRLSASVFNPKSIEKTSTKFATAIFNEHTIAALRFYNQQPEWIETADFLDYILKYWKILNVRTPDIGKCKRDVFRDVIRSSQDWKLGFLR